MFKPMNEEQPKESGLYQVFDSYRGWSLAWWDDGMWHLIPGTDSYRNSDGYYSYYHVRSWDYLHIPKDPYGKSVA
jgi:hypothetical protein